VLRPAQRHAAGAQQAVDAWDADAQADRLGQVVRQARGGPEREWQAEAARPLPHDLQEAFAVLRRDLRRRPRARCVGQTGGSLGLVAGEPTADRLLVLPHDGRDLGRDQAPLRREQDHLGARAHPDVPRRVVQAIELAQLLLAERVKADRPHRTLLTGTRPNQHPTTVLITHLVG
jgi:hypothetical protein